MSTASHCLYPSQPAVASGAERRAAWTPVLAVGARTTITSHSPHHLRPAKHRAPDAGTILPVATMRRGQALHGHQRVRSAARRALSKLQHAHGRGPSSLTRTRANCDERPTSPGAQMPSGGGAIRCSRSVAVGCARLRLTFRRWLMCRSPAQPGAGISTALHKLHRSPPPVASRAQRGEAATGRVSRSSLPLVALPLAKAER